MADDGAGPLSGVRVLEIANIIAGPTAGQVLGDFGADVLKIEHPEGGDGSRRQGRFKDGKPIWWKALGRNKRSICMYLGDPEAAEIFLRLVKDADVIIENFRPGTLERWGLGYDRLSEANPKIVLARLTGFGQSGPYSHKPAFGTNIEAMSGIADLTGESDRPPMLPMFALGDGIAGFCLVGAIMIALYHRDCGGGTGQVIDASLLRPLLALMSRQIMHYDQIGFRERRTGNTSQNSAPRNAYVTKDGKWVCLSASTAKVAARVMKMVGRPEFAEEPWFATAAGRVSHAAELDAAVASWIAARTRDEVLREAEKAETTFAPIYEIPEVMSDPHVRAAGMVAEVDDPDFGRMLMPSMLFGLSKTPGRVRWTGPELGSSTEKVLIEELGIDPGTVAKMRERGVLL